MEAMDIPMNSQRMRKHKLKIVLAIAIALILVMGIVIATFQSNAAIEVLDQSSKETVIQLDAASTAVDMEKVWRHSVEENMAQQEQSLQQKMEELQEKLQQANQVSESKKDEEIRGLKEQIKFIKAELEERELTTISQNEAGVKISNVAPEPARILRYTVNLSNPKNSKDYLPIKTADNYIAAGAFVKGVLLSGLDVSTSIKTIHDPEPVLIRLVDFGTLPRKFKIDLKDCHMIGSAFGDLSSERAKLRIEKLSCTEIKTGEIVETEVSGYVAGEDGRAGLRGHVVSVDQKYLMHAQLFGTLGGFAASSTKDPVSYNPFTIGTGAAKPMSDRDNIQNHLLTGAGNSLDKLAEYYIDRAESIQPVIQVAAGRQIDVIFTDGVYFGTSSLKQSLAKKRDERFKSQSETENRHFMERLEQ